MHAIAMKTICQDSSTAADQMYENKTVKAIHLLFKITLSKSETLKPESYSRIFSFMQVEPNALSSSLIQTHTS